MGFTLSKNTGSGNASITVTASANDTTEALSQVLTVKTTSGLTKQVTLNQKGINILHGTFSLATFVNNDYPNGHDDPYSHLSFFRALDKHTLLATKDYVGGADGRDGSFAIGTVKENQVEAFAAFIEMHLHLKMVIEENVTSEVTIFRLFGDYSDNYIDLRVYPNTRKGVIYQNYKGKIFTYEFQNEGVIEFYYGLNDINTEDPYITLTDMSSGTGRIVGTQLLGKGYKDLGVLVDKRPDLYSTFCRLYSVTPKFIRINIPNAGRMYFADNEDFFGWSVLSTLFEKK